MSERTLGTRIMGCLGSLFMMAIFTAMLVGTGWFVLSEVGGPGAPSASDGRDKTSRGGGAGRRR